MKNSQPFRGTAPYYAQYRPGYPREMFEDLVRRYDLASSTRVLDLGCGPGKVALDLAPYVGEIVAMDPNEGMLSEGRRLTDERGIENIAWTVGSSDDLEDRRDELGTFDLVVMGNSFHWMDREATLDVLYEMVEAGGGVAVACLSNVWRAKGDWQDRLREVLDRHLGPVKKGGSTSFRNSGELHQGPLSRSKFTGLETVQYPFERTWNIDEVVGVLYSTSFASPVVFGEKRDDFEEDLRRTLAPYAELEPLVERGEADVMYVWR